MHTKGSDVINGLCFYCGEPGSRISTCTNRFSQSTPGYQRMGSVQQVAQIDEYQLIHLHTSFSFEGSDHTLILVFYQFSHAWLAIWKKLHRPYHNYKAPHHPTRAQRFTLHQHKSTGNPSEEERLDSVQLTSLYAPAPCSQNKSASISLTFLRLP